MPICAPTASKGTDSSLLSLCWLVNPLRQGFSLCDVCIALSTVELLDATGAQKINTHTFHLNTNSGWDSMGCVVQMRLHDGSGPFWP